MNTKTIVKHVASFAVVMLVLVAPLAVSAAGWNTGTFRVSGLSQSSVGDIIVNILNWLLYILGFLAIVAFVVSGIMYIVSAGDDDGAKKAKSGMINAIIGIIVALLGYVVIQAVTVLLRGTGGAGA